MNNLTEFLADIYNQGWQLWSENGRLCYDAPKDKSTDSILETLKQYKAEISQFLNDYQNQLENLIYKTDSSQLIVVPLTGAQKQLWFLDQLEGNSKLAYIDYASFQLEGAFNFNAMERTIQAIVERHEALRTRISPEGNSQEVLPEIKYQLPLIDFSNLSVSEREYQVNQWLEEKKARTFQP